MNKKDKRVLDNITLDFKLLTTELKGYNSIEKSNRIKLFIDKFEEINKRIEILTKKEERNKRIKILNNLK